MRDLHLRRSACRSRVTPPFAGGDLAPPAHYCCFVPLWMRLVPVADRGAAPEANGT